MFRRFGPLLAFVLLGCQARIPTPGSLCEMPYRFPGWSGYEVHWRGLILVSRHGSSFIAEDCFRRGVSIDNFAPAADAQYDAFRAERPGAWADATVTARISGHHLIIENFHALRDVSDDDAERLMHRLGY